VSTAPPTTDAAADPGIASGLRRRLRDPLAPGPYRSRQYLTLGVVIVAIAVVGPLLATSRSNQFLVNLWLVYAIAGTGFYWVFGLAGRFAFCQTLMMAMGGYTSAYVVHRLGPPWFLVGVAAGVAAASVLALAIGWAARRTRDFYFAIATLAATEIGMVVFRHATAFTGPNGTVPGIAAPEIAGTRLRHDDQIFWLLLAALGLVLLVAVLLERSPLRRSAVAARDNTTVALTQGIPVTRLHLALFVLGSAAGGLSGALLGHWTGSLGTESFGLQMAIGIFLILLLGGAESMWGPLVGAAIFVALPRMLQAFERYQTIVYGGILLVVIIVFPHGVVGGFRRIRAALARRRTSAVRSSALRPDEPPHVEVPRAAR